MVLEVLEATADDREVLERLIDLYLHDCSEFDGRDVRADGSFHYCWLNAYQTDPDRKAYLFKVDGNLRALPLSG